MVLNSFRLSRLVCVLQVVIGLFLVVLGGFRWWSGGFVWLRLFEIVRTCSGCFRLFLIVLDCVGLFGCKTFFKLFNVVLG